MLGLVCARGLLEVGDPEIIDKKERFLKNFMISPVGHQLLLLQTIFLWHYHNPPILKIDINSSSIHQYYSAIFGMLRE